MGSSGSKTPSVQASGTSDKDNPKSPSKTAPKDSNVNSGGHSANQKPEDPKFSSETAPKDTNVKSGGHSANQKPKDSESPSKSAPQDTHANSGQSTNQKPAESQTAGQNPSDKQEAPKQAESQLSKQVESEKPAEKGPPTTGETTASPVKDQETNNKEATMAVSEDRYSLIDKCTLGMIIISICSTSTNKCSKLS
jgi:hypothetical protein